MLNINSRDCLKGESDMANKTKDNRGSENSDNMSHTSKKHTDNANHALKMILDNYEQMEKSIVNQLFFNHAHGTTIGTFREEIWKTLFEQIIPQKFKMEQSVFIIDSNKNISKEVDLVIMDEMYTPYIFRYGKIKFVPIEAVAAVIECKSKSYNDQNVKEWTGTMESLYTSTKSIARVQTQILFGKDMSEANYPLSNEFDKNQESSSKGIGSESKQYKANNQTSSCKKPCPTQTSTRPIRIFCYLEERSKNSVEKLFVKSNFHILITASQFNDGHLSVCFNPRLKTLQDWYLELNHKDWKETDESINSGSDISKYKLEEYMVKNGDKNISLLSLNLQLNQLLMLINNPMLFPHKAYADMFNGFSKENEKETEDGK